MKITVKNLKTAEFSSEETLCFRCTVYLDGVKAGEASNDGHGAPNSYWPRELEERLEAYAKTLPPREAFGRMIPLSADWILDDAIAEAQEEKRLRRLCRTSTLYRVKGEEYAEGSYMQLRCAFDPAVALALRVKYPQGVEIINERFA